MLEYGTWAKPTTVKSSDSRNIKIKMDWPEFNTWLSVRAVTTSVGLTWPTVVTRVCWQPVGDRAEPVHLQLYRPTEPLICLFTCWPLTLLLHPALLHFITSHLFCLLHLSTLHETLLLPCICGRVSYRRKQPNGGGQKQDVPQRGEVGEKQGDEIRERKKCKAAARQDRVWNEKEKMNKQEERENN